MAAAAALLGLAAAVMIAWTTEHARYTAASGELTVATWNTCGVRQWGCAGTGGAAEKRAALKRLATRSGARVVLLQEVCAADLEAVREDLGSWHTAFRAYAWRDGTGRTTTARCTEAGRGTAGFAVLSAHPLSAVRTVATPQPDVGLQRGILCASIAAHGIRVCTAHLSPPGNDRAHPGREFRGGELTALATAGAGRRTVYGGDLNVTSPGAHNPVSWVWPRVFYREHRECDQSSDVDRSGRPTHDSGHKIDYLFSGMPMAKCEVRDTGASDHRALLVRVLTG